MGFFAKKALATFLQPLGAAAFLLFVAWLRRGRRDAIVFVCFAVFIIYASALPWLPQALASPLEEGLQPHVRMANARAPALIVVLSGGYSPNLTRQPWDEMNESTLRRTLEGVRLAKLYPQATLWLSGGDGRAEAKAAVSMARLAQQLGIPSTRIRIEADSLDTHDQALALAKAVGDTPMLLVTSAFHMRRSLALFRTAGCQPIAAPTDFISSSQFRFSAYDLRPGGDSIDDTGKALHEYQGLLWSRLRGQL